MGLSKRYKVQNWAVVSTPLRGSKPLHYGIALISTPKMSILGRSFNPITDLTVPELLDPLSGEFDFREEHPSSHGGKTRNVIQRNIENPTPQKILSTLRGSMSATVAPDISIRIADSEGAGAELAYDGTLIEAHGRMQFQNDDGSEEEYPLRIGLYSSEHNGDYLLLIFWLTDQISDLNAEAAEPFGEVRLIESATGDRRNYLSVVHPESCLRACPTELGSHLWTENVRTEALILEQELTAVSELISQGSSRVQELLEVNAETRSTAESLYEEARGFELSQSVLNSLTATSDSLERIHSFERELNLFLITLDSLVSDGRELMSAFQGDFAQRTNSRPGDPSQIQQIGQIFNDSTAVLDAVSDTISLLESNIDDSLALVSTSRERLDDELSRPDNEELTDALDEIGISLNQSNEEISGLRVMLESIRKHFGSAKHSFSHIEAYESPDKSTVFGS